MIVILTIESRFSHLRDYHISWINITSHRHPYHRYREIRIGFLDSLYVRASGP